MPVRTFDPSNNHAHRSFHDSRPTPQARKQQKRRIKQTPPKAKPCIVRFQGMFTEYDKANKNLEVIQHGEPTTFPSRREAKKAIYWTVNHITSDRELQADLFPQYTIEVQ